MTAVSERQAGTRDDELVRVLAAPDDAEVAGSDAWWRAANYLTIGQIYLRGNPLAHLEDMPEVRDWTLRDWDQ